MVSFLKKYTSFYGCANRTEYLISWLSYIGFVIIGFIPFIILYAINEDLAIVGLILLIAISVVGIVMSIATSVRRLHDLGVSGWWIFGLWIIGGVGNAVSSMPDPAALLIGLVISFIPFGILQFVPGTKEEKELSPITI